MNTLLNLLLGFIIMAAVYLGMIAGGDASKEMALSTALLVGAVGVVPLLRADHLAEKMQARKRRTFEERIEASRDHVKLVVKECIEEVLPQVLDQDRPPHHLPRRRWRQ